jgi:hypothetical protein
LQSLAAQATSQYDEAKRLAAEQYSKASVAIAGTPKSAHEKALSSIESAYSDSLSAASVKFQSAMSYTASITSLWAKPTQGTYESISSAASVRLQEGLSQASAQYVLPIAFQDINGDVYDFDSGESLVSRTSES